MSDVQKVTTDTFVSEVLQNQTPVLVDFYADWCPPCRMLAPLLDRLAGEYAGQIKFVKVNSDENPELADRFGITGLPTVLLFQDGQQVGQFVGLPQEDELRQQLDQWIDSAPLKQ